MSNSEIVKIRVTSTSKAAGVTTTAKMVAFMLCKAGFNARLRHSASYRVSETSRVVARPFSGTPDSRLIVVVDDEYDEMRRVMVNEKRGLVEDVFTQIKKHAETLSGEAQLLRVNASSSRDAAFSLAAAIKDNAKKMEELMNAYYRIEESINKSC